MSENQNFPERSLFHGDNLEFLRGMNSETVHLIATDPPFNKGKDSHATPDSTAQGSSFQDRWTWKGDVHDEWVDSISDDWPDAMQLIRVVRDGYGEDMAAFLCFIGVRLMEMHRILRADGTIYVHFDTTARHYVKALMDAIFGRANFRNEIVWGFMGGGQPVKDFPRKHHNILRYTKSDVWTFNADAVRVPYDSEYEATVFAGEDTRAPGRTYEPHPEGEIVEDWWRGISRPYGKKRSGYPTEKPIELYRRMIVASSNEGDTVLDPFAGCATTLVAAERTGRRWVGIDLWDKAYETVLNRLRDERLNTPDYKGMSPQQIMNLTQGEVYYTNRPPVRTDDDSVAAPFLRVRMQRPKEPWQRLSHRVMRAILADAQRAPANHNHVICAGCGRSLELEFMELDHVNPRAEGNENWITNRILLCRPCNRKKLHRYTLTGLAELNRKDGWLVDRAAADSARTAVQLRASEIRDDFEGVDLGRYETH